jgi:hypothetical protein
MARAAVDEPPAAISCGRRPRPGRVLPLAGASRECDAWGLFERFTERARQVVVLAQEEARALTHNYIGTEHILLGLLREHEGLAAQALASLDITLERVRAQIVRIVGSGDEEVNAGQIPFTPRAKKVLEIALREALSLGHNYIGTEHILLGLVRENEGVAARVLLDFDADAEKVRNQVIRLLSGSSAGRSVVAHPQSGFDQWIRVGASASARRLLMVAAARALDDGRLEIEPHDVLLALTRDESTAPLLANLGVDEAAMRAALQPHPAPDDPAATSAET